MINIQSSSDFSSNEDEKKEEAHDGNELIETGLNYSNIDRFSSLLKVNFSAFFKIDSSIKVPFSLP